MIDPNTFAIAETAAALMDNVHENGHHERFYATRIDLDGMVGTWTTCVYVADAAESLLGSLWRDGSRDYLEDLDVLAAHMTLWQEEHRPVQSEQDARELVEAYLVSVPTTNPETNTLWPNPPSKNSSNVLTRLLGKVKRFFTR